MKQLFHILPALLSLLIGIEVLISCSEDIDTVNINGISSSVLPSSSSIVQNSSSDGNNSSSSNNSNSSSSSDGSSNYSSSDGSSSSKETPLPVPTINLPQSGAYASGYSITIPAATEQGTTVNCETSGAVPNENSSIKSNSQLTVTKNTILQCAYFKAGKPSSKTILRTYIVERLPDLPIVSIAVDPVKMFDGPSAIYKNDYKPGAGCSGSFYSEEEIPMYVDFFEKGADLAWSYPAGIKIHGGCSRKWPKKSVIVSFREKYGQKNLNYKLFPEHPKLTKFKHFMLRNGGNNYENDFIRDMLMSRLTEGLDIDYQKGRAVVVYYNGKYYGIHNLRERTNSDYFETNYNYNENYIDLVKLNGDSKEVNEGGSDADYERILNWLGWPADNSSNKPLADDNKLEQLKDWIDLDNFTNHFQSRIFYQDCDWPAKNMKRWRYNLYARSKWRWFLYDTDHGFGSWGTEVNGCGTMQYITSPTTTPTSSGKSDWPNPPSSTFLIRKLLENQNYRYAFINRFSVLLATYFTPARIKTKIDELMAPIKDEIPKDLERFPRTLLRDIETIRTFGSNRQSKMQDNLTSFFNFGTPVDFTLSVTGSGKVFVHNLLLPEKSVKFKAYPGAPITIRAEGAGFKCWSDGVSAAERTVTITKDSTITANF